MTTVEGGNGYVLNESLPGPLLFDVICLQFSHVKAGQVGDIANQELICFSTMRLLLISGFKNVSFKMMSLYFHLKNFCFSQGYFFVTSVHCLY